MQLICKCGLYASVYGNYGSKEVVSDMLVFIADRRPTCLSDLMDNGREEIGRMVKWLFPILERAGCDISAIQDQWVSMKIQITGQFCKIDMTAYVRHSSLSNFTKPTTEMS